MPYSGCIERTIMSNSKNERKASRFPLSSLWLTIYTIIIIFYALWSYLHTPNPVPLYLFLLTNLYCIFILFLQKKQGLIALAGSGSIYTIFTIIQGLLPQNLSLLVSHFVLTLITVILYLNFNAQAPEGFQS